MKLTRVLEEFLDSVEGIEVMSLDSLERLLTFGGFHEDPATVQRLLQARANGRATLKRPTRRGRFVPHLCAPPARQRRCNIAFSFVR